jgi:Stress responsive A/B Barrel Domain
MMNGKSISSVEWRLKQSSSARARPWITLLCIAAISLPGAELLAANKSEVSHVAFIWLKRPGNHADQQALIRAAKRFRNIHGVVRVDAGVGMPIARQGIEQPFDVGAVIVFRDRGALGNYEKDPRHLVAMREILQPLAKRYVIYNFSND